MLERFKNRLSQSPNATTVSTLPAAEDDDPFFLASSGNRPSTMPNGSNAPPLLEGEPPPANSPPMNSPRLSVRSSIIGSHYAEHDEYDDAWASVGQATSTAHPELSHQSTAEFVRGREAVAEETRRRQTVHQVYESTWASVGEESSSPSKGSQAPPTGFGNLNASDCEHGDAKNEVPEVCRTDKRCISDASTAEGDSGSEWAVDQSFMLGNVAESERFLKQGILLLDSSVYTTIEAGTEALNAGSVSCEDVSCLVLNEADQGYYLLWRRGKKDQALTAFCTKPRVSLPPQEPTSAYSMFLCCQRR